MIDLYQIYVECVVASNLDDTSGMTAEDYIAFTASEYGRTLTPAQAKLIVDSRAAMHEARIAEGREGLTGGDIRKFMYASLKHEMLGGSNSK